MKNRVLAMMMKREANNLEFDVVGSSYVKDEAPKFMVAGNDDFLKKLINNDFSESERNYIISTICDFFIEECEGSQDFLWYAFGNFLEQYYAGNESMINPVKSIINFKFVDANCCAKQRSGSLLFSKYKFAMCDLSKIFTTDVDSALEQVFYKIWDIGEYMKKSMDLENLLEIPESEKERIKNLSETTEQ